MTLAKHDIIATIENGLNTASTQGIAPWMGATNGLLALMIDNRLPFSSGEIAAQLRTFRPDLRFSVTGIGEYVRERFYADTLPSFPNPDGTLSSVEQVPRVTQGIGRTPPGTSVFVYAPSYQEGVDHPFEVDIPTPGVPVPVDPDGLPPVPVQSPTPASHFVQLAPRKAAAGLKAAVHSNLRCYIPRSAFEELLHETGTALKGGDSVYIAVDDVEGVVIVSLDPIPNSQAHQLVATRGVVQFTHPVRPFTPNQTFPITVNGPNRRLVVDIS